MPLWVMPKGERSYYQDLGAGDEAALRAAGASRKG